MAQAAALFPSGPGAKGRTCTGCKLLLTTKVAKTPKSMCELRCAACLLPDGSYSGYVKLDLSSCSAKGRIVPTASGELQVRAAAQCNHATRACLWLRHSQHPIHPSITAWPEAMPHESLTPCCIGVGVTNTRGLRVHAVCAVSVTQLCVRWP